MSMENDFIKPVCELCHSCDIRKLYTKDGITIVRCFNCGLCFVFPREAPETIAKRYNSYEYFDNKYVQKYGYGKYEDNRFLNDLWITKILKRISRYANPPGKALDIGCAMGYFLLQAKNIGWEVEGLERSEYAVRSAREHFNLTIHHETLEDNSLPSESYQLVTLFDVIEHVQNAAKAFQELQRIVKPKGWVVITTPNEGGWTRIVMRKYWFHFKPLEHAYFFSNNTLRKFLENHGFEVVYWERCYKIINLDTMVNRAFHYTSMLPKIIQILLGRSRLKYLPYPFPTGEVTFIARKR